MLRADFDEDSRRRDDSATARPDPAGGEEQLASVSAGHVGSQVVRRSDEYRRQVFDRQLAGDRRPALEEQQAAVKVVDNGSDRAAMDNAGRTYVAGVELMPCLDAVALSNGPEMMPVGVVRPAPQAVVVVDRQFGAVGVANELLRPHSQQRMHVSHAGLPADAVPRQ